MNIFILDENPSFAASQMCDKHVVKMVLETGQLLSTAHRVLDGIKTEIITSSKRKYTTYIHTDSFRESVLYKSTMPNHPCALWCRQTNENYEWLAHHGVSLLREYTLRYGKVHKSSSLISWLYRNIPINIPTGKLTPFVLAMPDRYKTQDAVESYRNYYMHDKSRFAEWKNRPVPSWYFSLKILEESNEELK